MEVTTIEGIASPEGGSWAQAQQSDRATGYPVVIVELDGDQRTNDR